MGLPILSSRQFRRGRVLYNPSGSGCYVLLHSPRPGRWYTVWIPDDSSLPVTLSEASSKGLMLACKQYGLGVQRTITRVDAASWVSAAEKKWGITIKSPWVVIRAMSSYQAYTAPLPKPKIVAGTVYKDSPDEPAEPAPSVSVAPAKRRNSTFSAPPIEQNPYWYESDDDRKLVRDFISLRQSGRTVNLMISGPSGAGKTVGVQRLGQELGIPVHIINCQAITTPEKWIGQMHADPQNGTYFEPSQHIKWVERTHEDCEGAEWCILLYDEITRLRPELNNMTYSLFDTQRGLEVPQMGRRVYMSDRNIIISTANIGAAFSGTFGQDRAFRERFAMTMERDFPPVEEEIKILTSATGIDEKDARSISIIAEATRVKWREQQIEQPISTRTAVMWALLVSGGYDLMQAAEYTVLPLYSDDGGVESDRAKVRLEIQAKTN